MSYPNIIGKVSKELSIPVEVVDRAYKSYWDFIKDKIQSLPLKEDINEEEFAKLKTNFNLPALGKLSCTYDRMIGVKKKYKYINTLRKNNEETIHKSAHEG